MKFSEIVKETITLLQESGRTTYRALKLEFDLDDEQLDALKEELLFSRPEISEVDGRGLIWNGEAEQSSPPQSTPSQPEPQPPSAYTPPHLAERIRAEQAAMESRGAADGERKTITALFVDLKGSTALIAVCGGQDWKPRVKPYRSLAHAAIHANIHLSLWSATRACLPQAAEQPRLCPIVLRQRCWGGSLYRRTSYLL